MPIESTLDLVTPKPPQLPKRFLPHAWPISWAPALISTPRFT
jgi:hypothetical protein